ncbi:glutathione transferase GstA [Acidovorax carolinensis]|uniref:glutathione transferase GstA n=1 Tax=Acidovorax carolinensis TaxID=553814 RepID=UPI000B3410C1|nr:glutathione transferase GstA [Acidovorax carolinensis]ART47615.1 glutathione transferase GstA [Acidovorax carolinensis]
MIKKLYGAPGACSLAAHIALHEAGLTFNYVPVDLRTRQTSDGRSLADLNSKGYVPVLELEDGQILTEVPVVLQYIADLAPEKGLAPPAGVLPRYRLQEWLSFINSELHKAFGPLFMPGASEEAKAQSRTRVLQRLTWVDAQLAGRTYLVGEQFTVADVYLFVVAGWTKFTGIDVQELTRLGSYLGRIAQRPAVEAAMRAEGLVK